MGQTGSTTRVRLKEHLNEIENNEFKFNLHLIPVGHTTRFLGTKSKKLDLLESLEMNKRNKA